MDNLSQIFNRPPQIADDAVQYFIYPSPENSSKAEVEALGAQLQLYTEEQLPGHLWNRDSFEVKPVEKDGANSGWHLEGTMRVGDSIDDEWLAVWLLKEMTARWDIAVSLYDTDGDFLLIEAAEHLPSWIDPSNAENRVWIYQSHLHLVPLSYKSIHRDGIQRRKFPGNNGSDDELGGGSLDSAVDFINIPDALRAVRTDTEGTLAPKDVEAAALQRTVKYPAAARMHIHYTSVFLPVDVARALTAQSSLVQKAAEAFYTRDAMQLRAVHRMARFPPNPVVLDTVKITRTAYAQLVGQKFHPPKVFGRWAEPEGSDQWRRRDIGMKIACGFEILFTEGRSVSAGFTSSTARSALEGLKDTMSRDPSYHQYMQTLKRTGYFGNELQGSSKWKEREEKALTGFVDMHRKDDASRPTFAALVNDALERCPAEDYHPAVREEDSDEWLIVDPENVDGMLQIPEQVSSPGQPTEGNKTEEEATENQASKLKTLATKVQAFVEGRGSLEGAEFEDDANVDSDDDDDMDLARFSDPETDSDDSGEEQRKAAMDSLVPGLEPSEYGRMPASYYNNSQSVAQESLEHKAAKSTTEPLEESSTTMRRPLLPRDDFDGVDSDDATDSDEERLNQTGDRGDENSDEEEDRPQVVGDVEIDMSAETEEFLQFSREALGIDLKLWDTILQEREGRGAFVPKMMTGRGAPLIPEKPIGPNEKLNSFEAVMEAMETELAARKSTQSPTSEARAKDHASRAGPADDNSASIEEAMEAELKGALKDDGDDDEEEGDLGSADVDYNLIKNFLESFKSQGGLSGPVSNMAGRLEPGWQLPRDA